MAEAQNLENSDYFLPKKACNKKTLVLDLDETLVHSQFQPFNVPSDIILKVELEEELHDIHVMVRPGVKEFLENMGKIYEIVIFTASVSKYADPLLDILDKDKNCKFRLFREHCTPINTCYVKEIKKLGRELKDIVIVDNSPMSYALNPENGLPIITWFEDKEDRELYNISSILEFLSFVPDVRNYINQFVVNDEISYNNVINVFDRYNEMLTQKKITKNNYIKKKSKDNKKILNKNNSKIKFNNNSNSNRLISENKENISNNNINNNNTRFKKNITVSNLRAKEEDTIDIKINLNMINKKVRPNSKNSNKSEKNEEKNSWNTLNAIKPVAESPSGRSSFRLKTNQYNESPKRKLKLREQIINIKNSNIIINNFKKNNIFREYYSTTYSKKFTKKPKKYSLQLFKSNAEENSNKVPLKTEIFSAGEDLQEIPNKNQKIKKRIKYVNFRNIKIPKILLRQSNIFNAEIDKINEIVIDNILII